MDLLVGVRKIHSLVREKGGRVGKILFVLILKKIRKIMCPE
jgi:hypothetical protein